MEISNLMDLPGKKRKEQELNVKKKEKAKVDHKNKSLAGMQKKLQGNF